MYLKGVHDHHGTEKKEQIRVAQGTATAAASLVGGSHRNAASAVGVGIGSTPVEEIHTCDAKKHGELRRAKFWANGQREQNAYSLGVVLAGELVW